MDLSLTVSFERYNGTLSVLFKWIRDITTKELSDLLDTKESELYVCDKPYHKNTKKRQKGRGEIKHLLNGALP